MPFNPPSNDWNKAPVKPKISPSQWNNYKGYDNFLSKDGLNQRSRARGALAMNSKFVRVQKELVAKQSLEQQIREEAHWRKVHENSVKKHWVSKSQSKLID